MQVRCSSIGLNLAITAHPTTILFRIIHSSWKSSENWISLGWQVALLKLWRLGTWVSQLLICVFCSCYSDPQAAILFVRECLHRCGHQSFLHISFRQWVWVCLGARGRRLLLLGKCNVDNWKQSSSDRACSCPVRVLVVCQSQAGCCVIEATVSPCHCVSGPVQQHLACHGHAFHTPYLL